MKSTFNKLSEPDGRVSHASNTNPDPFTVLVDNADGVCPHQESDIQRCEARKLLGWAAGKQEAAHHPHH